jgi:hypothetical protein
MLPCHVSYMQPSTAAEINVFFRSKVIVQSDTQNEELFHTLVKITSIPYEVF